MVDLPWVERAACRLVDHFAMKRVNEGLARGLSFREAFGDAFKMLGGGGRAP